MKTSYCQSSEKRKFSSGGFSTFIFHQKYLENYYNLKDDGKKMVKQRNHSPVVEKLKQMQKFFGLKVTGRPDAETLHVMQQGWCGGPDVAPYVLTEGNPRWEHTDLTYR